MIHSQVSGWGAYDAATIGRLYDDQPIHEVHAQDAYAAEARTLMARGAHLPRNNAYAKAMINAMQSGIVGAHGLLYKNQYQAVDGVVTPEDRVLRADLSLRIWTAMHHIDAAGLLTPRQFQDGWVYGKAVHGEAINIRVATERPWARYAVAWRNVHPSRVRNPDDRPDSDSQYQGVQLSEAGDPVGLHIATGGHRGSRPKWIYVPLRDRMGVEQVVWHSARTEPEQIRAPGWFTPVMELLIHLGKVTLAHTVAKRLQACLGMIIEVDDPVAAARKDRNGVAWTRDTKIEPGKTYYLKKGSNVRPFDFKYNGADYEAFTNALLQAICAGFGPGIPYQFALQQLTKSNMASARAALMQAWRSFRREQVDHEHCLRIVVKNYLWEDLNRGRLIVPGGVTLETLERVSAGFFIPPQRLSTDDHRDLLAMELKRAVLRISRSTLAREYGGYDLEDEREQDREDQELDRANGLDFTTPGNAAELAAAIDAIDREDRENEEPEDPDDDPEDDVEEIQEDADAQADRTKPA